MKIRYSVPLGFFFCSSGVIAAPWQICFDPNQRANDRSTRVFSVSRQNQEGIDDPVYLQLRTLKNNTRKDSEPFPSKVTPYAVLNSTSRRILILTRPQ
ncbi:hypothetical protein RRG08_004120 [Elysia crispata]|uniref:Uncharacterized protein n=1 Tax=Elysia crispata TaxID=231223 RepID=A0AAE0YVY6_9GAST|nr:hypothetical protein RRG08_004120 [Elysia crispata]